MTSTISSSEDTTQGCMQKGGGGNLADKRGGRGRWAEAYVRCYTLHLLGGGGGGEWHKGGGKCPSPPLPP